MMNMKSLTITVYFRDVKRDKGLPITARFEGHMFSSRHLITSVVVSGRGIISTILQYYIPYCSYDLFKHREDVYIGCVFY